ncbi:PRC-barrel domain-containing protein [Rhizobium sp. LjRoot30]|uniref:PRC-barrel domain-containing protein n=1 Tax=Rhizobium sp. LjRoot30 TaxID=3342320 RepID=UPI003ECEE4A6
MLKKLLTTAAAGALLMGATATYAQDTTKPMDTTTQSQTMDGAATTTPEATPDAAANTPATADTTNQTAAAGDTYLTQQSPDEISANTYIGQPVYNGANENVGDINDLILKKDGGIVAAVIGVGGFLGIGEKYVAVPIQNVAVSQDAEGSDLKLTTTETAESLKAAPEFKTLAMQTAERSNATTGVGMTPTDSTTTSSTTTDTTATPPAE